MALEEYVSFKKFITPTFINIIYMLGAAVITFFSLLLFLQGADAPVFFGLSLRGFYYIQAFIWLIAGNLIWRVYCEYIIITFRMYDRLYSIDQKFGLTDEPLKLKVTPPKSKTFCFNCGNKLRKGVAFCEKCGSKVE